MDFISELFLFLFKTAFVGVAIVAVVMAITSSRRNKPEGFMAANSLNAEMEDIKSFNVVDGLKKKVKVVKEDELNRSRVYVISFDGDSNASETDDLRKEITTLLSMHSSGDANIAEVIIKLNSGGGSAHRYGLAAAQLKRLRDAGLKTTVCVDEVAASGGYMMACVADRIVASPFSIIGSIGVVVGMPNFSGLLKKHDVEMNIFTAGEHKRTITPFTPVTESARAKVNDEINTLHRLFKKWIVSFRPDIDIEKVSTGETWSGTEALELGLVDEIEVSDQFIMGLMKDHEVYEIEFKRIPTKNARFSRVAKSMTDAVVQTLSGHFNKTI